MINKAGLILAAEDIERKFEFAQRPEGWAGLLLLTLFLGLLYVVIFFYRREQRAGASVRARIFLATLRCAVLVILAGIWLQPILATYIHRKIEACTLLLVDGSASMSLSDRYPDADDAGRVRKALKGIDGADVRQMRRAELVEALLTRNDSETLRRLSANNVVQVYRFGDKLELLGRLVSGGMADAQPADTSETGQNPTVQNKSWESVLTGLAQASSPATDIGRAVRQAVETQAGTPIAAVVVFSDGRFNKGESAEVVARYARAKKIPIHVVGVGDPSPPLNVRVTALQAPPHVFVKDPFKVIAHLEARELAGSTLEVQLLERSQDSQEVKVLQTKRVVVGEHGRIEPVVFNHQLLQAQQVQLQVRVPVVEGEMLAEDNQREVVVRGLDSKMRVLLVAGAPNWEYRYLVRLLTRDRTIDVSCWLQSADQEAVRDGNTIIDHFVSKKEELYKYDCVILLDPQPDDFNRDWSKLVEALVSEQGGGLLYIAGRKNASRFAHDADTAELIDLLPVVIDPQEADLIINELGHYQTVAWPLAMPPAAAKHAVLALSDQPGENRQIWARLPGVYWHYPVRREKPVATVLLRHSNPRMRNAYGGHVLMATQFLGAGRTGFLAYDGTWRWRRYGDRYFNRFWIQLLRHMVEGKLLGGQTRGSIQISRDNYAIGEMVTVEAHLLTSRRLPLREDNIEVAINVHEQRESSITLNAQPNRPGWYRGQFVPNKMGTHVLQIELASEGGKPGSIIRGEVSVGKADLEFVQPQLDRASLERLASGSAGGRYFNIDEVDQLVSQIPSKTTSLVITGQSVNLWDNWWTLVVLVVLLGIEWAGRKRVHLL